MTQNNLNSLLIFIILFFGYSNCFANDSSKYILSHSRIGIEQGLAGKRANCGMQDSNGFIWFGTMQGLQRYDGKNFKTFTKEKNGLQDNVVAQIIEDEQQQLWIMYGQDGGNSIPTGGKVDILDLKTNKIQSLTNKLGNAIPFKENKLGLMYSNEKHQLFFVVRTKEAQPWQAQLFNSYSYSKLRGFEKQIDIQVYDYPFLIYKGNEIIVRDNNKTILYNLRSKNILPITYDNGKEFTNIFSLDKKDNLFRINYVPNLPGVYQSISIASTQLGKGTVRKIGDTKEYLKTFGSLFDIYSFTSIMNINGKAISLFQDGDITTLLTDKDWPKEINLRIFGYFKSGDNMYWICSSNGIYKVKLTENKFEHLLSSDKYQYVDDNQHQTRNIILDNVGGYYINTWGGHYQTKRLDKKQWSVKALSEGFGTDGMYFDGKKIYQSALIEKKTYDSSNKSYKFLAPDDVPIWLGISTKDSVDIIAKYFSIILKKKSENVFKSVVFCDGSDLPNSWVQQFYYTRDGTLWAVGSNGLYQFNGSTCITKIYNAESKDPKYKLPTSNINGMYEDQQGIIWLATAELGLLKWDIKKHNFEKFNNENGLVTNLLYAILEDDYNNLWISSDNGLIRFNKTTKKIKTYTTADGITNNEFNRNSFLQGYNGEMLFGGLDGVNIFKPVDLLNDTVNNNPSLNIVSFFQFDKASNQLVDKTDKFLNDNHITVNPGDDFFTLEFQLQDYNDGIAKYAYMIEGIDNDWIYIKESSIRVAGLPYGNYTLKVKGRNNQDSWSNKELSIPITVITPLLKKSWFQLLMFLALLGIIYTIFRYRTHQLGKDKETLEKTVAERTLELNTSLQQKEVLLKEIHHRVKNNLAVVAGLLDMQASSTSNFEAKAIMQESQNRVAAIALIHQRLYQNKDMSAIEIRGFVEDMYGQIGTVFSRTDKNIKGNFLLPNMALDIDTAIPLGLIINELITNSFKYAFSEGKEGLITIDVKKIEVGHYTLIYKDNGPGLPAGFDLSNIKTLGMRLVNLLAKQLSGTAAYRYENEQSIFTINFKDGNTRNNE